MAKHLLVVLLFVSVGACNAPAAVITLSNGTPGYSQNFDSLAASGTSSATPVGWSFVENGLSGLYAAGTGSSNVGDTYSFGTGTNTDRAFGELTTLTFASTFGAQFENDGSTAIQSVSIEYTGEQWRIGNNGAARTDRLNFQYSLNASSLTTGSWTSVSSLNFLSPITTGVVGAINGNLGSNQSDRSGSITSLNLTTGNTLWIRWMGFNATGNDDGLAIDDFTITATFAAAPAAVPEPGTFALLLTGLSTVLIRRFRTLSL
ncbi:MAG: PEP-CTERM sorting domain-containing protein [Planctomycetales bacterium]|nr:PEP-CTERM sorting domain-containing protein [Planctomycetales bacterium]